MTDDNTLHALLLAWILYYAATDTLIRGVALGAVGLISVSVIVKFFIS